MMATKLTVKDMKTIARERGGDFVSKNYFGLAEKHKWKCKKEHVWRATPASIKAGSWCKKCKRILVEKELKEIAKSKGGKFLSKQFRRMDVKHKWQCKKGHIWKTMPVSVKSGAWCPKCWAERNGKWRMKTIADMQKLARKKGGKCLSKEYE